MRNPVFLRKKPEQDPEEDVSPTRTKKVLRIIFKIFMILLILGFLATAALFAFIAKDLPNPGNVNNRFIIESTKIYDRTGTHLLYEVHGEEKRTIIDFKDIPESLIAATLSLEDQGFYEHFGIQPKAILRAALKDIITLDAAQGASTITQQFVKNSLLSNERTLTRKVKEVILSLEIEAKFDKDEILSMYLNEIPYGSNAYGIEAAAQTFFGKSAREITLDEAALLASLPRGTAFYSPYGSRPERVVNRKNYALKQMAGLGYITNEQADEAIAIDTLQKIKPQKNIIAAPHFVMYVREYLQNKYGDQNIEQNGLKVITTLDWDKQMAAEEAVRTNADKNKRWKAANAALVAIDPKTGQILSLVGSKDYFGTSEPAGCISGKSCAFEPNFNVAVSERQPGSSFKPYVYLTAFTKGYLPETMLYDTKTQFETAEGKSYEPNNYDGKFHGPVTIMKALGGSLNVPAVKTLYLVGVKDAIALAKNLGITDLNHPEQLGLSLVLGGGEVKLLDHVNAYATLANNGIKHEKTAILRVEDSKGTVLEEYQDTPGEQVVDQKYVAMLDSVMSNNDNRAWVFGENSPLAFKDRPVAAKTGTTNEFRDGWTIGYTPSLAVGVWAGNNDNSPMTEGADGVNVAAPIWRAFLDKALINTATEEFPKYNPDDEIGEGEGKTDKAMLTGKLEQKENLKVCEIPGKKESYCRANKYCLDKDIKKRDFISPHDILFYVNREDPRGPIPDKPDRDSQYKNWEKGVKDYYSDKKDVILDEPPKDECDESDFSENEPSIRFTSAGSYSSQNINLTVSVDAPYGVKSVRYSIGNNEIGATSSKPYSINYSVPSDKNGSDVTVSVEVIDNNGNSSSDSGKIRANF
ncbi:MAG: PBP1A family penicillin-binding protein [Candidatus Moranbacteria bacterium]|nr:PBP1A family penicillin-binding protein [Candidatus Moranbacteria bacterium]